MFILLRRYIKNILVAVDQLFSAVSGGDPDETISSRVGKAVRGDYGPTQSVLLRPMKVFIDLIFWPFDGPDHCLRRIEEDEGKYAIDITTDMKEPEHGTTLD